MTGEPTPIPNWKRVALATFNTLVVCLGGLQSGFMFVFSSPLLDDFQTHLPPNFTVWSGFNQCVYQDLVGPIGPAGAFFGSIFSSPVVAMTGFVTGLVFMSSIFVSGWLLIAVSYFTYHGGAWSPVWFRTLLLLGRLLTGVGTGWAAGVVPVYIGEVSPPAIRGRLGALFEVALAVGMLLVYLLGSYMLYWQLAFVCAAISVVQLVLMFTIQESPRLSRNPLKNIRERLVKRRSDCVESTNGKATTTKNKAVSQKKGNTNVKSYLLRMKKPSFQLKMSTKSNIVRIVIVSNLMMFQAVSGVDAITTLAGPIFRAAGLDSGDISSGLLASLTIGVVFTIFTVLSLFVVDRFGRRIPLFFGGLALMAANIGMAVYFTSAFGFVSYPDSGNSSLFNNTASILNCVNVPLEPSPLASNLSPLPIASVCFFFAAFSLSWGPVPWIIGGELFPDQIREVGMGISASVNWLSMVVVMTLFPVISEAIGEAIPFLAMAVIGLLSSIFVVLFLAETKGLSLDQISSMEVTNVRKNVKEFGLLLTWLFHCGFVRKIDLPHYLT